MTDRPLRPADGYDRLLTLLDDDEVMAEQRVVVAGSEGTLWPSQSQIVEARDVSPETMRLIFGFDPGAEDPVVTSCAVEVRATQHLCPFVTPRKRKGLTGKRYRIARRRWARDVKAWRRGLVPGRTVVTHYYVNPAMVAAIPGDPGAYSVGFRGQSLGAGWVDEALTVPRDAKPGYDG